MKNRINCFNLLTIIFIFSIIFTSCSIRKKVIYFQGNESAKASDTTALGFSAIIQPNDFISIIVGGLNMEAVAPFNLPQMANVGNVTGYAMGSPNMSGYTVEANGMIDFPVIGQIKLGGLDRIAATNILKEKLKPYINDPTVNIRILNFKITVLGDVSKPGTYMIANERITLPQAIGLTGDLNISGLRKNVLVIREINGKKSETRVDLTSNEIFNSPVYYLCQNDLIYVEPNRARVNSSLVNATNISLLVSVVSLMITTIILIKRN